MDNKALLDRLAAQVSILEHHIKRLKKKPDELHELDIELMAEKIKVFYDLIHELQPGNMTEKHDVPPVGVVEKVPMVEVKPEPEIPAPKAPEMSSELKEKANLVEVPEDVTASVEASVKEPAPAEVPEDESVSAEASAHKEDTSIEEPATRNEAPPAETAVEEAEAGSEEPSAAPPEPEIPEVPKTTADLFSGPTTIADTFQAAGDNSIASKVNPTAVRDLKSAIGINDKFLFINELFKGDPSVYNQAIDNLNTAAGAHEATAAIESYRSEYTWADNSEAYHRLKKIVMSKYNG